LAKNFITGGQNNVGLRVPDHPIALALLRKFEDLGGQGIAAPSANRFGAVSPTTANAVEEELGAYFAANDSILDGGQCEIGIESSIVDFIKLGYKKIDIHSIFLKYSFPDENHNLSLSIANAIKIPSQDEKIEEMLFEVSIFSEFEPGSTFSSYFLCSKNDFEKFNLEIVNYLNSNLVVYNSEIILYLESLESYMISIGYEVFNPITCQISCSYTLETLPNQWQEILGNELYSDIKNIEKSILIINKQDCKDLEEELPF
jgi:hypothetical protein